MIHDSPDPARQALSAARKAFCLLFVPLFFPLRSASAEGSPNLLTNPGAESGNLSGWSVIGPASVHTDAGTFNPGLNPQSGAWDFVGGTGASAALFQRITLTGLAPVWQQIDAGTAIASVSFYEQSIVQSPADTATVFLAFLDASQAVISIPAATNYSDNAWTNHTFNLLIPSGTRYIDYYMSFTRNTGNDLDAYIDSNSLILGFNGTTWSSAANNHLWNTAANWASGVPTSALPARLTRTSGTETVTFDGNYNAALSALYIDSPDSITLSQSANTMRATSEFVGNTYNGTYTQSGGSNITPNLYLGYYAGNSHGTYNLSGGTLAADTQYVGYLGQGDVAQSGGANTPQNLYVGYAIGGNGGTYTLSAGNLTVASNEYVGYGTIGLFSQTGGIHSIGNTLYISNIIGIHSIGTYNLTGGTLSATLIYVGAPGGVALSGAMSVSGSGKLFATIQVWNDSPVDSLTLADGGTINGTIYSDPSLFHFTGGTLNWTGTSDFIIDPTSPNTPILYSTSFTGSQVINLPCNLIIGNGSLASLTLAGPESITVGDPVNNKSLQIGALSGPSSDSMTLSNSNAHLTVNGTIYVGGNTTGSGSNGLLAITNGHVSANAITLWVDSNASLSAGTLDIGTINFNFASGLTVSGGTATILNPINMPSAGSIFLVGGTLRISAIEISSISNLQWSGGTLVLLEGAMLGQASLTVPAPGTLTGSGIVFSPVVLKGAISVANPNDSLTIHGTIIGPGNITVSANTTLTSDAIQANILTIAGLARIRPGGSILKLNSLTIAGATSNWTGKLDLNDNALIIHYDTPAHGTALLATTYNQIITARGKQDADGISDYSGNGITSSTAAANNLMAGFEKFSIGVINNADLVAIGINPAYTTFQGLAGIAVKSILARYTYSGDINLDGEINIDDYNYIDDGFAGALPGFSGEIIGDFNNDGKINIDDYNVIDAGFALQGMPLSEGELSPLDGPIPRSGLPNPAPVPEPAALAFLLPALALLFKRQRYTCDKPARSKPHFACLLPCGTIPLP